MPPPAPPPALNLADLLFTLDIELAGVMLHSSAHEAVEVLSRNLEGHDGPHDTADGIDFDLRQAPLMVSTAEQPGAVHTFRPELFDVVVTVLRKSDGAVARLISRQNGDGRYSGYQVNQGSILSANPSLQGMLPVCVHFDLIRTLGAPLQGCLGTWVTENAIAPYHDDDEDNPGVNLEATFHFGKVCAESSDLRTIETTAEPDDSIVVRPDSVEVRRIVVHFLMRAKSQEVPHHLSWLLICRMLAERLVFQ